MDDVPAALADATRRRILEVLAGQHLTAGEIAQLFPVSRPAVSRHLRVLRESNLITDRVVGRQRIYSLNPAPLEEFIRWAGRILAPASRVPNLDALATEVQRAARDRRERENQQEEIA